MGGKKRSGKKSGRALSSCAPIGYTGKLRLYSSIRPRIFTIEGTASTYIATTGAGVLNFNFTMGQFGFSGATYPIITQFSSNSSYQVRAVAATCSYVPLYGTSAAYGAGCGVAAVVHESTLVTVNIANVLSILGWKHVRVGAPFKLVWRSQNINESLWYSGGTSSLASSPSPGFLMVAATTGGVASQTVGEAFFSFILQVREQ
jgi:hypothetical protein